MRYMLMMHVPGGTADYQINSWTPEDFQAHMAFMHRLNKDLTEAGEFAADLQLEYRATVELAATPVSIVEIGASLGVPVGVARNHRYQSAADCALTAERATAMLLTVRPRERGDRPE